MAFVYEEVGEQNRELWESIGWKNWGKHKLIYLKSGKWSIDRERGIFAVYRWIYRYAILL